MPNIWFDFKPHRLKHFFVTGRGSFYATSRCFSSCLPDFRIGNPQRFQRSNPSETSVSYQVKGVKMFTCVTSFGGILIQPLLVQNILNGDNVPLGVAVFCCVGFFTFLTPFLVHLITKKYVTEIWYNAATDTYTATVLSFFLRKIPITFKIEDVAVPSVLPLFSTMNIKGRPVFIISDSFLEMKHYIKMMGYDKPMDMKSNPVTDGTQASRSKAKSGVL